MFEALAITLREGLSAFLVAAVMLAFFTRGGHDKFREATWWGIGLSVPATAAAAALFAGAANQAWWEGLLALTGAAAVAWLAWHMWRSPPPHAVAFPRALTWVVICAITVLMITRGAMEIALLLGTIIVQVPALDVLAGAALGPLIAVVVGVLWSRAGHRVPQRVFAHVTAVFLFVLFAQLLVDGLSEVTEANAFAGAQAWHAATQPFSSDGAYGQYAQYALIAVPVAWSLLALFWGHGKATVERSADMDR